MRFNCTDPECPGGEICRKRAVKKITELIEEAAYGRKVVHPCLSRWWKFTPCARIILFGIAFFRLWRNAAPIKKKGMPAIEPVQIDGINIDMGDDWHAMHNWRVGATFDFFARPTLCSTLILTLQSLQCGHQIMGWIMKYLGFHRNASIDGGDDAEPNANAAGGRCMLKTGAKHCWSLRARKHPWYTGHCAMELPFSKIKRSGLHISHIIRLRWQKRI